MACPLRVRRFISGTRRFDMNGRAVRIMNSMGLSGAHGVRSIFQFTHEPERAGQSELTQAARCRDLLMS
ncbi:MAG: hypothetical protein BGP20_15055 [Thiobacillus sp. 63-78]|nr:MAG: hypothetical protein BGP20_15055 [Thiobacillus sp. 63-78]